MFFNDRVREFAGIYTYIRRMGMFYVIYSIFILDQAHIYDCGLYSVFLSIVCGINLKAHSTTLVLAKPFLCNSEMEIRVIFITK